MSIICLLVQCFMEEDHPAPPPPLLQEFTGPSAVSSICRGKCLISPMFSVPMYCSRLAMLPVDSLQPGCPSLETQFDEWCQKAQTSARGQCRVWVDSASGRKFLWRCERSKQSLVSCESRTKFLTHGYLRCTHFTS